MSQLDRAELIQRDPAEWVRESTGDYGPGGIGQ